MASKMEESAKKLNDKTIDTLKRLDLIWNELGLDNETREQRNIMFFKHVEDLYKEMLFEAEDCKINLLANIESLCKELSDLQRNLRIDIPIEDYENVALFKVKQELKFKIQKYQQIYDARKSEINKLLAHEKSLCFTLGKKTKDITLLPLPTREELLNFQIYLEELSDLKFRREEIFLKTKARIIEIMNELNIKPSLDFERKVVECEDSVFTVSDENIKLLEEFQSSLENQLMETKIKVAELRETITILWERLEESPQVRSEFLELHPGNSVQTMLNLKAAVLKLEDRKKANIKLFVDKMRQELVQWWNKCRSSPQERAQFLHFHCDVYTEDLLTLHEIQVEKLKNNYEKNIAIYNMYSKRENLWKRMLDLEQLANQPDRYKNRGGQLLTEEKERKTIAAQLPKIENELLELVNQNEEENNVTFLIYGDRVKNLIDQAWHEYTENKKIYISVKKKLREQIGITPTKSPYIGCQSRIMPSISLTKRKLDTPLQGTCKRSRMESTFKSSSKLQILESATKKVSMDKKYRMEKQRKYPRLNPNNSMQTTTNYESFENELEAKSSCRSSLFPEMQLKGNKTPHSLSTPRKTLVIVNNTSQGTPSSQLSHRPKNLRIFTSRLATAPSHLPINI